MDEAETLEADIAKLIRQKEAAIHQLCYLVHHFDGLARQQAREFLREIGYDSKRIRDVLKLGSPPM